MRKAIGILLMAVLMAICFVATAAPALPGATTTYMKSDVTPGLFPVAATVQAGQEVSHSAVIAIGAGSSGISIAKTTEEIGAGSGDQRIALSARSLGATPFRICS